MTRKDYETVAACLERALNAPDSPRDEAQVRDIAARLALEFKLDNPRFDERRFMQACGFHFCTNCGNALALDADGDWRCSACGSAWADTGEGPDYA